ncbi:response regulator [Sphingomonas sp. A2-49]|uniref:response regulator transcription factor n=1 Tax=Sphingomonas sp. A2-49 TaxID=1391375 RepID=UPI0021D0FB5F|nr:response regulator [Sphingomonas sp. A2-49]MCU6453180.1 response regulator [Sphingomonas sp. A2-49]
MTLQPAGLSNVYVVDDDPDLAASVARLLSRHGYVAEPFADPVAALAALSTGWAHCIVTDVMMGELDGFGFADRVRGIDTSVAVVFMTAWPTAADAVDAIRRHRGLDYLEKPIDEDRLLAAVGEGVRWSKRCRSDAARIAALTPREHEVFRLLARGHVNKVIADRMGISPKTVEDHRAAVLAKTGSQNLAQVIALAAALSDRS